MLGSDYRELIVPKLDNNGKKAGILIGGGILTLACIALSFAVGRFFLLLIAAALGFGTWYLWTENCVEYEYIIAGDELTITKILAESRRKPLLSVSIKKFTAFGKLQDAERGGNSQTTVLACSAQNDSAYYADFDHPQLGQTRMVFTPNDDILAYLSKHLPRNLGFRYIET